MNSICSNNPDKRKWLDRNTQSREDEWNSIKWIKPDENPMNLLKGVSRNGEWYCEMV